MSSTAQASQSELAHLSNKFDGRLPVRVHFLDNSSKVFLLQKDETVQVLMEGLLQKIGIQDQSLLPYYGLFESRDGASIGSSLSLDTVVSKIIKEWSQAKVDKVAKFLFMIRLFMPSLMGLEYRDVVAYRVCGKSSSDAITIETYLREADVTDTNALHIQFVQAVFNIIIGKYPTTLEQALELGAIHFLYKFGNYNPVSHKKGFLGNRIVEFIPAKHLKTSANGSLLDWESKLLDRIQLIVTDPKLSVVSIATTFTGNGIPLNSENDDNTATNWPPVRFLTPGKHEPIPAQQKYMEIIYSMPCYGSTFFRCRQKSSTVLPESPYVGIYHEGIQIFDKTKRVLAKVYHIEEIYRWGFKPNLMFYFEVNPEDELGDVKSMEFESVEGKDISDLMTDYAMAFLREREAQDLRAKKNQPIKSSVALGLTNRMSMALSKKPMHTTSSSSSATASHTTASTQVRLKAVVKIQALYRGFALRNEWAREDAAILIQSVYRGYRARIILNNMIEELILAGEL